MLKTIKKYYGVTGLIAVQTNILPVAYDIIINGLLIPILTPLLALYGLSMYMIHALTVTKSPLYIWGNAIGLIVNTTVLVSLLTPWGNNMDIRLYDKTTNKEIARTECEVSLITKGNDYDIILDEKQLEALHMQILYYNDLITF